jgi:2,4-dienoyl-CoA reductase-like NADH-dependent reductase (Old Yellow Enzyme family)/thioredoxin reductase
MRFPHLFAPGTIGRLTLANRIVMPAISTKYASADGEVTDRYVAFCGARARGGVGLIVIENTCVDWPRGKGGVNPVRIDRDRFLPGLSDLAEEVHRWGAKIATQLQHVGRQTGLHVTEGITPIAPSPIPGVGQRDVPRPMTPADIAEVVELYGEAARRTKQAGFDAVEIHGAHGYLITQFLSPLLNRRDDEYGGSLENRLRVPLAIVRRVREAVGPEFPVIFRYSADEGVPGGLGVDEATVIARRLEDAGVDALHVSAGLYESAHRIFPVMAMPAGCHVPLAAAVKAVVRIPVIAVGKLNDPALAEAVLARGEADYVAIGRQLLADPDFPTKAREGRVEEIRPCLSCNNGCLGHLLRQWRLRCDVNPALGRESQPARPASRRRRVLVVGGGPAGMRCAIDAAARGHEVLLCERSPDLGGLLNVGCRPPGKDQIRLFRDYLAGEVARAGIEVRLETTVDAALVDRLAPDVVVVATGARPGWGNLEHDGQGVFFAEDVLRGAAIGGPAVVVVGGGQVGGETAEALADAGRQVTLVEALDTIASDLDPASRAHLQMRLATLGVTVLRNTRATRVEATGVEMMAADGPARLSADAVVAAVGYVPRIELARDLSSRGRPLVVIGDCVRPRRIYEAIHEAAHAAQVLGE